jgi:2-polyprenyl-6-methoxyphenol hydroxylase-like FAD-dependent oxidoreductase
MKAELPSRVADNKAMVFTFGRNGFFGYASGAPATQNSLMWWSTFETDSLPSKVNVDVDDIKAKLKERHSHWADPVVQDIVSKAEVQSIYPTWVLPDLPLWGENGIVLVGDAAHAMSPTTGQGASQALEDAQTLSLILTETLKKAYSPDLTEAPDANQPKSWATKEQDAISQTLKLFYNIRQPRVHEIAARGRKIDGGKRNVSIFEEYAMYCFLWLMMRFPFLGKTSIKSLDIIFEVANDKS